MKAPKPSSSTTPLLHYSITPLLHSDLDELPSILKYTCANHISCVTLQRLPPSNPHASNKLLLPPPILPYISIPSPNRPCKRAARHILQPLQIHISAGEGYSAGTPAYDARNGERKLQYI